MGRRRTVRARSLDQIVRLLTGGDEEYGRAEPERRGGRGRPRKHVLFDEYLMLSVDGLLDEQPDLTVRAAVYKVLKRLKNDSDWGEHECAEWLQRLTPSAVEKRYYRFRRRS